jgi:hypothetical protein
MNNQLDWQITRSEKRTRVQKSIFVFGPFLFLVIMGPFLTNGIFDFRKIIYVALVGIIILLMVILANKIFPHKEKQYSLNNYGITISVGRKTKTYSWNEFESFYSYSLVIRKSANPSISHQVAELNKDIRGDTFYLRKKSNNLISKLYKTFVVVYSETDNSEMVNEFLVNHLPKKEMTNTTDLGLVFYEFKGSHNILALAIGILISAFLIFGAISISREGKNIIGPLDHCDVLNDQTNKYNCYSLVGSSNQDLSICDKIPDLKIKSACYSSIANTAKSSSICDKVQDLTYRDNCYISIGRVRGDPSICDKIQSQEIKNDCHKSLPNNTTGTIIIP